MTQVWFKQKDVSPRSLARAIQRLSQEGHILLSQPDVWKWGRWSLLTCVATVMWDWDWKLVLATATGIGSLSLIYLALNQQWQPYWRLWLQTARSSQGQLSLAAGGGGLAALGTYLAAAVWAESDDHWLATGMIVEGLATLLTLAFVLWHFVQHQMQSHHQQFEQLLLQLSSGDRLQQLIIVRQLGKRWQRGQLSPAEAEELGEYFYLLLAQTPDPALRQAVLEYLPKKRAPLQIPRPALRRQANTVELFR